MYKDNSAIINDDSIFHSPRDFNNRSKREELLFLIQWEGFSTEHNSWEPWEKLKSRFSS